MDILIVDDDELDRELFTDAINLVGKGYNVNAASNGKEALDLLIDHSKLPDLIILDLNMPIKDGKATLHELKIHPKLKRIPVCIMSTSSSEIDISFSYDNGANLFLVKPHDFKQLIEMLTSLLTLFNRYVTLPKVSV